MPLAAPFTRSPTLTPLPDFVKQDSHHSAAFTLTTYIHLLPNDLPNPSFLDTITNPENASAHAPGPRAVTL